MASLTSSELIHDLNINYYFTVIPTTFLVHEYCLTFVLEVERFWCSKKTSWVAALFFLNRYLTLFGHGPVLVEYFWYSTSTNKMTVCHGFQSYYQYFALVVELVVGAMFIVRTFALYERSRRILALLVAVAFAGVVFAGWCIIFGQEDYTSIEYFVDVGCPPVCSRDQGLRYAGAWGGKLMFDTLVFGLTAYKSVWGYQMTIAGPNLFTIMLRDGSIYFGIIVALNIANILTFVYGGAFTRGLMTSFINVFSSTIITRFMINIRDPSLSGMSQSSRMSAVVFQKTTVVSTSSNAQKEAELVRTDCVVHEEVELGKPLMSC